MRVHIRVRRVLLLLFRFLGIRRKPLRASRTQPLEISEEDLLAIQSDWEAVGRDFEAVGNDFHSVFGPSLAPAPRRPERG